MITTAKFHRRRLGTGFTGHMDEVGWRQEEGSFSHCDSSEVEGRREDLWAGIDFVVGNSGWELTT